jgi:hypothetical protein
MDRQACVEIFVEEVWLASEKSKKLEVTNKIANLKYKIGN